MFLTIFDTVGGILNFALNALPWVIGAILIIFIITWILELVGKFKSYGTGPKVHAFISIAAAIAAFIILYQWFGSIWWSLFWSVGLGFMIISPESPEEKTSRTYSKPSAPQEPGYIQGLVDDYMEDMRRKESVRKGVEEAIRNTRRD